MRIFDPHIHMTSRTTDDYEAMHAAGVRALVEPAFWLGQPRTNVGSFLDYFDSLVGWERFRAAQFGIAHHCTIALNPKEANDPRCVEVLDLLPRYLDKDGVVAVGEVGFDSMTEAEEKAFSRQLELAVEFGLPAMVHTPHRDKGGRHPAHPRAGRGLRSGAGDGGRRPPQRGDRRPGRRQRLLDGVLDLPRHQDGRAPDGSHPPGPRPRPGAGQLRRRLGSQRPPSRPPRRAGPCSRPGSPRTTSTGSCGATRSSSSASPAG
ncbi:TatD family hydrolase [Nocardioides sp. TF02-7]|uniref:TatD family hydrolase n=1 Tax=Nocardioides sp. TF02-7 TaxID=2917724 RepID=UPI001F063AFC|nr:TatD family hydrolase [Nocardioides sp. TF02-7]UMG92420.1 TatD family hydrolase [Nocardioides sp. TF02-7]